MATLVPCARSTIAALAAIASLSGASRAAIIVNGDFATNNLTGWTWTPDPNSEPAMVASTAPGPFGTPPAFQVNPGSATSGIGSLGGVLSQTVMLTAGVGYTVTGDLAIQNVAGGPNADGGTITIMLGGSLLHTFDVGQIAGDTTQTDTFSSPFVPVATGPAVFEIHFSRDFPNFVPNILHFADNLAIVPAPGAAPFIAVGVVATALSRRRRPA